MLVNCNSCQKKFQIPDSAISETGRLLQCGSCGNKWTQYPIKEKLEQGIKKIVSPKIKNTAKINKKKTSFVKKKREINLYSKEYLKKKYGLSLEGSSDSKEEERNINKKIKITFGFYSYLITISIFFVAFFGILNLSKDIIVRNYPVTKPLINYLFETINIIKITIFELLY